jgi:hypothetical protein
MSDDPMNPQRDPAGPDPIDLDEAVSAFLDGEPVDDATRARPEFADRLAELTLARDALGDAEPVPALDDLTRRRLVRTAVDAAADDGDARTATWMRRLGPLGAAAAVLAVVVGLGALVVSGGDDSDSTAVTSADSSRDDSGGGAGAESATPDAVGGAPSDLGDLGDVSDLDALAGEVEAQTTAREGDLGAAELALPCAAEITAVAPGPIVATGTGTFEGRPAAVVVTTDATGEQVVLVATTDDCAVERAP